MRIIPLHRTPSSKHSKASGEKCAPAFPHLQVADKPLTEIVRPNRAVRRRSRKQAEKLANSILRYGFVVPILIEANGQIIDGVARYEAALSLGMTDIPVIVVDHLTPVELKALRLSLNKIQELGEWDEDALRLEFETILEMEPGFALEDTGFETPEIDFILDGGSAHGGDQNDPDDELPTPTEEPAISKRGDVWVFPNGHRLCCGDTKDNETWARVLKGETAQAVFIDPPYNVPVNGHVSGLGRTRHREFHEASGEMSDAQFSAFLKCVLERHIKHLIDGALVYVCMDWRHLELLLAAGRACGLTLFNLCIWNKTNGGMGSFYRSKHELVCVFKHGTASPINNVELGKHGRYRTNVWDYAGVNSFGRGRMDQLEAHPTAKPVALVADAIMDCTRRGDIVLDGFAGAGTTLIAAERCGRRAICVEIDPAYVDTTIRRFQDRYGGEARHEESGLTFSELAAQRLAEREAADAEDAPVETPEPIRRRLPPRRAPMRAAR